MATPPYKLPFAQVPPEANAFYADAIRILNESGIPFMLAGTFALTVYTGIERPTKDLDVFCRAGDYPRILTTFAKLGFETEIQDERWIAKVWKGEHFFDVIFNSTSTQAPVNDQWFEHTRMAEIYGQPVRLIAPTELIWSKMFVQDRTRYDGSDVAHTILRQHDAVDWKRLMTYAEACWEVLFIHVLNFRFLYPSERDLIPRWVFDELVQRLQDRAELPAPQTRVCRGSLFSQKDYQIDVAEWGFADIVGMGGQTYAH
ncbi:MAG TPA: hypothetical protein VEH84_10325 [Alphaproteobacteria bacterium]|nr:hypothetical protein [Alphaproteobacteria bacterium]